MTLAFGLPILGFHLLAEILIDGGRACAVEEDEDFEFLFHAISLVLSFRAKSRNLSIYSKAN
jgi:hypothetical protein